MSLLRKTHLPLLPQRQPQSNNEVDDDNDDIIVNDDITLGRNRRIAELGKIVDVDLSEYVKLRLWLARQLALEKYDQIQG